MDHECERCTELAAAVNEVLEQIKTLTKFQLETFQNHDMSEFGRLDKELENAMGLKERCIGAFREHQKTHGTRSKPELAL